MSLDMNYQSLGVKMTGSSTTVPDNELAKLMYYLDCVFGVIQFDGAERYTNYQEYYLLTFDEKKTVLYLAGLFNPKIMVDSYLFLVGSRFVPEGKSNQFFDITDSRIGIHVNSEVMIGGVSRRVLKVMGCTESWLNRNYFTPVETYYKRAQLPASGSQNSTGNNKDCCYYCGRFLDCLYLLTYRCFLLCLCDSNFSRTCKRTIAVLIIFFIALDITIILANKL